MKKPTKPWIALVVIAAGVVVSAQRAQFEVA
jgi:hypothetical protein